jgi:hypothetical protein
MVCFRYIIVNSPHKGDKNDDDDDNNNNNYTRSGITNQICDKNVTNKKRIANADSVNNLMNLWSPSHLHVQ